MSPVGVGAAGVGWWTETGAGGIEGSGREDRASERDDDPD